MFIQQFINSFTVNQMLLHPHWCTKYVTHRQTNSNKYRKVWCNFLHFVSPRQSQWAAEKSRWKMLSVWFQSNILQLVWAETSHTSLYCSSAVTQSGETINHNTTPSVKIQIMYVIRCVAHIFSHTHAALISSCFDTRLSPHTGFSYLSSAKLLLTPCRLRGPLLFFFLCFFVSISACSNFLFSFFSFEIFHIDHYCFFVVAAVVLSVY